MQQNKTKAVGFALACIVLWAFIPVVSKTGQQSLDNYQFLFWSSLLSFLVLLGITLISKKGHWFTKYNFGQIAKNLGLGFLGAYLYYLLLYFAYAHARGLEVLVLQYTWPLFIVLLSIPVLREKLTKMTILSSLLGFTGVLIVLTKGNFTHVYLGNLTTDGLVLLGSLSFGLFSVLTKKVKLEYYTDTTLFFASATLFSLISMLIFSRFSWPSYSTLLPLFVNGAFINGLSYVFWLKALRYAKASFVAPLVFITPVLAAVLITIFFHEIFLPIYVLGICLVISAGLLSQKNT